MKSMKLALEGFVVLISILLAFYLEGWRDDRELDREVKQELLSVKQELERNKTLIQAQIIVLDQIIHSSDKLINQLESNIGSKKLSIPDTLAFISAFFSPTFDPSIGAIQSIITSGRLAKINNQQLKLGLAGLKDLFYDAKEDEETARDITVNRVVSLLLLENDIKMSEFHYIIKEVFGKEGKGLSPIERVTNTQFPSLGNVDFPNNLKIRNILRYKTNWYVGGRREYITIMSHINDLIKLVDEEIAGKN